MTATSFPVGRRARVDARSPMPIATSTPSISTHAYVSATGMALDRDRFYAEFAPLVRRLIRRFGQNQEMQEDLRGEIYCRFCALLEAFDPMRGVPLRAYIVRQLTLATYTYARQQWRIQRRESTWDLGGNEVEQAVAFDPTADWLEVLAQKDIATLLPQALQDLPARQRNVVIWRYFEERSFEEIAEMLGVQPVSARSLLRHALNNLRKALHIADCH